MSQSTTWVEPTPRTLAVIVPAWKPDFLRQTLESIGRQAQPDCDYFLFDDAGPPEVARIAAEHPRFRYHRFDCNQGGHALVPHLNRCLQRVTNEWVWLFSDDDLMAPGSLVAVLQAIGARPDAAVFQTAVRMVDATAQKVLWSSVPPAHESATDFLKARLHGSRLSCLPDHVFSWRRLRPLHGGLVDLPLAWNADDATWLLLGRDAGLFGVPEAEVLWRQSGLNISSSASGDWQKLAADLEFLRLLDTWGLADTEVNHLARVWLMRRLTSIYGFGLRDLPPLRRALPPGMRRWLAPAAARMARRAVRSGW